MTDSTPLVLQDDFDPGLAYSTYRLRKFSFYLAGLTAFFASLSFMVMAYAGSSLFDDWTLQQTFYGLIGVGIVATVTLFQLTLYSSSELKREKWVAFAMMAVAISFAIITETGGGMQREEARVEVRSSNSISMQGVKKAIEQASSNLTSNPYQPALENAYKALSEAEYELGRCNRHASIGQWRVDRCVTYESQRIASNKRLVSRLTNQEKEIKRDSLATMDALFSTAKQYERDDQFHMAIVRALKTTLNTTFDIASLVLFLTTVCIFEVALHYLGRRYVDAREALLAHGYDLVRFMRRTPRRLKHAADKQIENKKETIAQLAGQDSTRAIEQSTKREPEVVPSTVLHNEQTLYQVIRELVITQELAPNVRALKRAMKKGGHFSDDIIRQQKAEEILDTLHCDTLMNLRILLPNPAYTPGGLKCPKYVLNPAIVESV